MLDFLSSRRAEMVTFVVVTLAAACGGNSSNDTAGPGAGTAGQGGGGPGGAGGAAGAGVGGAAGVGGTSMTAGSAGSGGSGGANGVEGSYDLVFKSVVAMTRPGSPTTSPPSEGATLRIDLRRAAGSYEALVTPRWGTPVAYSVMAASSELTLAGSATVTGGNFGALTDKWKELRLGIDAATGGLSGTVQASGEEMILMGDVIDTAALTAGGSVKADSTLPDVRSEVRSGILPEGQMLPWEGLAVRAAEGVGAEPFRTGLSVSRTSPDPNAPMPSTEWVPGPTDATAWGGAVTAVGHTKSWDELGGIPMTLRVPSTAVVDRATHAMAANYSAGFTFFDIKLAATYPLDAGPTGVPPQWGEVTVHGMSSADPLCEVGVCALLGPFQNGYCSVGRRGLAGRLTAPRPPSGAPSNRGIVRVRYRVMTAPGTGQTLPTGGPAPFSVDVAVLGAEPSTTEVKMPALRDLGAGAGEFRYASDFLDAVATSPDVGAPPSEFGFAIYAGTRSTISCGPGGLLPPPVKTQVIIDKITIEPG
jgi:hypothetical protein